MDSFMINSTINVRVGQGIADVLQLLVRRRARHQQAALVPDGDAADKAAARDRGVDDGDMVRQFLLKHAVKILAPAQRRKAVAVGGGRVGGRKEGGMGARATCVRVLLCMSASLLRRSTKKRRTHAPVG